MGKRNKRLICSLVSVSVLALAYIYFANAFIYYRIGAGNLSAPIIKAAYYMNKDINESKPLTYVALGDSLTAGAGTTKQDESFPYLLAEKIAGSDKKVVLNNFSYPGAQTEDLIKNLLDNAIASKPDIVTLLIGVNDIHNHVSPEAFKQRYQHILERLTKETQAKIYLINIPFIGSETIILPPLDFYFDAETKKFNDIIKDLSADYNLKTIDLYSSSYEMLRYDGPHYSPDSFHPSASGYEIWANIIYDDFDK